MKNSLEIVDAYGYQQCVSLGNGLVNLILEPNLGGRVLEYSRGGKNAFYIKHADNGKLRHDWPEPPGWTSPCGGRCDIGPELTTPFHPVLWLDSYKAEMVGKNGARLTSNDCNVTGIRLIRDFVLDENTGKVLFTQTMKNVSSEPTAFFHWSRTFAVGNGICFAPVNPASRYPKGYLVYGPGDVIDYMPDEEAAFSIRDGVLEIRSAPQRAKFALDQSEGWLAYLTRDNLLFVKKFPVYPNRVYGEIAANNVSIWYYNHEVCEIEPIGPVEHLNPGEEASYTEQWWLLDHPFPESGSADIGSIKKIVNSLI